MSTLTNFIGGQHYVDADGNTRHLQVRVMTESDYDDLSTYEPNTLYLLTNVTS